MKKEKTNNNLLSVYRGALMGVSILCIIVFHFTEDCENFAFHYSGWIKWFRTYIGSSSVDAFLFLSGLGLYYSMKKNADIVAFYQRRMIKLLIPYVIVAVPCWIVLDVVLEKAGWWETIKDFTFISFFKEGDKWYWYVGLMMLCYLIYPYVFQIVDTAADAIDGEMRLICLTSAITVISLVIEVYDKEVFSNVNIALLRLPIFLAGCFYGRSSYEKRTSYWKWALLFVMSAILLTMLPAESPIFSRYVTGIFNVSFCAGLAWVFSRIQMKPVVKVLEWFGKYSLELYLVHVTVRKFMNRAGYRTCHLRYEFVMVLASIVLAWLLQRIVQVVQKAIRSGSRTGGNV